MADNDNFAANEVWLKAMLPANATLQQAISNLDQTALQVVLVIAVDGTLLGTVTDGDIRRGLLRGLTMQSLIDEITHREPLVVPRQLSRDMVLQLMQANKIHQLPIVDSIAAERDAILNATNDMGLMTRPAWTLMHRLTAFNECPRMALPVAESLERRLINLPSSVSLGMKAWS